MRGVVPHCQSSWKKANPRVGDASYSGSGDVDLLYVNPHPRIFLERLERMEEEEETEIEAEM